MTTVLDTFDANSGVVDRSTVARKGRRNVVVGHLDVDDAQPSMQVMNMRKTKQCCGADLELVTTVMEEQRLSLFS